MPGMFELGPLAFFAVADAFILVGVAYDRATRGRVHPVWIYGGIAIVVSQVLRLAISATAPWASFVQFLVG